MSSYHGDVLNVELGRGTQNWSHQPLQASSIHSLGSTDSQTSGGTSKPVPFPERECCFQSYAEPHWRLHHHLVAQPCPALCNPMVHQAPLSMGFCWQEYWSGLPVSSPGDHPNPEIKHGSATLQADSLPSEPPVQFSSVAQSCLTLCNPVDYSTPGLPVCHQLLEFTQTHIH